MAKDEKTLRIKFLEPMAVFSGPSRNVGDVRDVPEAEALRLIDKGIAEIDREDPKENTRARRRGAEEA